ncbi:MAG: class I SAM-dependent methyltransferase [Patescibacteria group bacterium]
MRIYYRYPKLYELIVTKLLYSKRLIERFREVVGKNQSVFEVAAGYGRVARFIDPSNVYRGIDLNEGFVHHGRELGLDLEVKDIFDPLAYRTSDVCIAVDLIHHVPTEKLKPLFDLIFSHTGRKVVIMEASFQPMKRYGILGTLIEWIFCMIDDDGINKMKRVRTDREYEQLFENRFGSKHGKDFDLAYEKIEGKHPYQLVTFTRK